MDPTQLERLPPVEVGPSLSDRVYQTLKEHIATQRLTPGSKLSVPRLAGQLGVSRTPVKEALERLQKDGLVATIPNRGAFVAIINAKDVNEIYQMREMLEGLAASLAAGSMDDARLAALDRLQRAGAEAVQRRNLAEHTRIDLEFHRLLREWAGNRRLARALEGLQYQVRIVFRTSATIPGRMERAVQEHRRIVDALATRDPDQAEAAARAHVRQVREAVMAYLERSRPGSP